MEAKTMPSPLNVVGVNFMVNDSLALRYQDFLSKVRTAKFSIFILFLVIMQWNLFWYIHHPDLFKSRSFWPGSDPELYFWILNRFRPFLHKACTGRVLGKDWKRYGTYPLSLAPPWYIITSWYRTDRMPDSPAFRDLQKRTPRKAYTLDVHMLLVKRHPAPSNCWWWKDIMHVHTAGYGKTYTAPPYCWWWKDTSCTSIPYFIYGCWWC